MGKRHIVALTVVLVLLSTVAGFAGAKSSATKLNATMLSPLATYGVFDDGNALYQHGVNAVQVYFGVSGKDLDLVTYTTPRKFHFKFDPTSPAYKASGLPASGDFYAVVDFYGVNYYGRYVDQGDWTTAQVHGVLQFYVGRLTYQLDYQSLASYRKPGNDWLITTDKGDIPGYPGFYASDQAMLSVIRRNAQTDYGTVTMPMRFEVVPQ